MASDAAAPHVKSRPLSPHLQIWRWTPTMAASITHRVTGVALYSGTILLAFWAFALSRGEAFYAPVAAFVGSPVGMAILFGYVWALFFHGLNGLRHLYWDSGRGLAVKTARLTAIATFAASLLLAIVVVAAGLPAR